jgi:probable rRNA maturation factor
VLEVEVIGHGGPGAPSRAEVERVVGIAFASAGVDEGHVAIEYVGPERIASLNEEFRGRPGPTDVLSFPLDEADGSAKDGAEDGDGIRHLGDVVVAPAEAERNNPADPEGELRLLLVHGILHLLGYDHEEEDARTQMWERQEHYSGVRAS